VVWHAGLATDGRQKINATNSWNFALIDYFHDMSLLKEGDGVNFQRASCTLDGCVKIYTNRVDSVATETGKLLSGLAESNQNSRGKGEVEGEDGDGDNDDDDDGDESGKRRAKKKVRI
jgi:condensin complex subunit 2